MIFTYYSFVSSFAYDLPLGTIPDTLCNASLQYFYAYDNPNISCYADCLKSINTFRVDYIPTCNGVPPSNQSFQDIGLCGIIGSTYIETYYSSIWNCNIYGTTTTNPCTASWPAISCNSDGYVSSISFPSYNYLQGTTVLILNI